MEWYVARNSSDKKENELKHYGIKGQEWGKRNYQNYDGTLTPEGKIRYKKDSKIVSVSKDEIKKVKDRPKKEAALAKRAEDQRNKKFADEYREYISQFHLDNPEASEALGRLFELGIHDDVAMAMVEFNGDYYLYTRSELHNLLTKALEEGKSLNNIKVIGKYNSLSDKQKAEKDLLDYTEKHKRANK